MVEVRSHVATIAGHVRPAIRVEPNQEAAERYAWSNWSIAKWEDGLRYRFVARFAEGLHEVKLVAWDRWEGVERFDRI
jgi:hypothetical protein